MGKRESVDHGVIGVGRVAVVGVDEHAALVVGVACESDLESGSVHLSDLSVCLS